MAEFELDRFVQAQAGAYPAALAELKAGRKRSHWMWFVFPQLAGLGRSETARFYAISSVEEARAYAAHPVLGVRLREATAAAIGSGVAAGPLFGYPDDLKFRSCMTLFARAVPEDMVFAQALDALCGGEADAATRPMRRRSNCSPLPSRRSAETGFYGYRIATVTALPDGETAILAGAEAGVPTDGPCPFPT